MYLWRICMCSWVKNISIYWNLWCIYIRNFWLNIKSCASTVESCASWFHGKSTNIVFMLSVSIHRYYWSKLRKTDLEQTEKSLHFQPDRRESTILFGWEFDKKKRLLLLIPKGSFYPVKILLFYGLQKRGVFAYICWVQVFLHQSLLIQSSGTVRLATSPTPTATECASAA